MKENSEASRREPSASETARTVALFEAFVQRCVEADEQADTDAEVAFVPALAEVPAATAELLKSLEIENVELRRRYFRVQTQCDVQERAQEELVQRSQLAGARVRELETAIRTCELGLAGGSKTTAPALSAGLHHLDAAAELFEGEETPQHQRLNFGLKTEPMDEPLSKQQPRAISKSPAVKSKKRTRPLPPTVTVTGMMDDEPGGQAEQTPPDASSAAEIFGQWLRLTHENLSDATVKTYVGIVKKHEAQGWRRAPDNNAEKAALGHFATFRKMGLQSDEAVEPETFNASQASIPAEDPTSKKQRVAPVSTPISGRRVAPASTPLNASLWARAAQKAPSHKLWKRPSCAG